MPGPLLYFAAVQQQKRLLRDHPKQPFDLRWSCGDLNPIHPLAYANVADLDTSDA